MKAGKVTVAVALVAFVAVSQGRWAAAGERFPTQDEAERRLVPSGEPSPPPNDVAPAAPSLRLAVNPFLLEGAAFYDAVGRPDLAHRYRTRQGWKTGSRVIGGISLGLGALAWVVARSVEFTFGSSACGVGAALGDMSPCTPAYKTLWVPDLMMAGGLALLIVPSLWSNDPVSLEEKLRLANEAGTRGVSWNVSAAPAPGGGTIVLGGRF